ncbi:MAG: NAD(P)H-dependent glycerol-3-phosphate dehydrogenase [Kangiellaceae bacterium]|nr:NAD(P)H-dependent glycerol-3-phosphate dehydrogenase [Kangiellaceae bacterium]
MNTDSQFSPIAVLGAGSFGTALAILLAGNGNPTRLWCRDKQQAALLNEQRQNAKYLPDIQFPSTLEITSDISYALEDAADVLVVTPSGAFADTLNLIKPVISSETRIAWACKGLEPKSAKLLSEVAEEILGPDRALAVISGPTFAKELARAMPTAVTIAANQKSFAIELSERCLNAAFRSYISDDMVGVQLGGALKNIIAVGAGISDGMGFGANARTALITRGLAEIQRLGLILGGKSETFHGLACLGDLVLTCTDDQSRNRRFGLAIGKGMSVDQAISSIGQVVEGAKNAHQAVILAGRYQVDMPISQSIYNIIHEGADPQQQAFELLGRKPKKENK